VRDYAAICDKYINDVLTAEVVACQALQQAVKRHLRDLRDLPEFTYDLDEAARACAFIEKLPHTKGRWAGRGEKFIMSPWQVFATCMIFGWLRADGTRRFREIYFQVARKNGKSLWAAAVGLLLFVADGEFGPEVYSGATTERQAWEVFGPARLMCSKTPALVDHFGVDVRASSLSTPADNGKFIAVVGNMGDGSSPSCAIVDEYHEHKTPALYDTFKTGMGARDNPLLIVITTAGTDTSGPCYERKQHAAAVLADVIQDDALFALLFELDEGDDWGDPAVLAKANPNMGVSVSEEFLLAAQIEAKGSPRRANMFRIKHCNEWVNAKTTWLNLVTFKACGADLAMSDYEHLECIVSIDFASRTDMCAGAVTFTELIDDKRHYYIFPRFWLPSDTVESDRVGHYAQWYNAGLLESVDGAELDYGVVLEWIRNQLSALDVREFVFDPWRTNFLAQELIKEGVVAVEFRNTPKNLTEAMREVEAAIAGGRLHYAQTPVLEWMAGNAVLRSLPNELTTIDKEHTSKKIDGISTLLMGVARAQYSREAAKITSIYETTSLA
jgi:phage terminase large subunit-like protein